jgi:hypothetical protein
VLRSVAVQLRYTKHLADAKSRLFRTEPQGGGSHTPALVLYSVVRSNIDDQRLFVDAQGVSADLS